MELINKQYFGEWRQQLGVDLSSAFDALRKMELEAHSFTFYTSVSVMSSSRIEGEQMEVDSYVKHKLLHTEYLPDLVQKPNDLYQAYVFASGHALTKDHFHQAHGLLATHLLPPGLHGKVRTTEMMVLEHQTGRIQYEAARQVVVAAEYERFWHDLSAIMDAPLSVEEVFYYAAYIHLVFVNIHPFADGNGRAARLLEKWFVAQHLGDRAWYIQSEKYYYQHVNDYYARLARLGMFYDQLDYSRSLPFLGMLPQSLTFKG